MAVSKVDSEELSQLLEKLRLVVDGNKDLPSNIFLDGDRMFWFFERPIISFVDIFYRLISGSIFEFKSSVIIKFSGVSSVVGSCFRLSGEDVDKDILWLSEKFENFFSGTISYPIFMFSEDHEWVAYESANEEFGVVAVRTTVSQSGFLNVLNSDFIPLKELDLLSFDNSTEGSIARAFMSEYGRLERE